MIQAKPRVFINCHLDLPPQESPIPPPKLAKTGLSMVLSWRWFLGGRTGGLAIWRGFRFLIGIVQKVFSPKGVPSIFDAFLTQTWRVSDAFWNVPLFPIKQDPIWRISDAFLTHFWRMPTHSRKHLLDDTDLNPGFRNLGTSGLPNLWFAGGSYLY